MFSRGLTIVRIRARELFSESGMIEVDHGINDVERLEGELAEIADAAPHHGAWLLINGRSIAQRLWLSERHNREAGLDRARRAFHSR